MFAGDDSISLVVTRSKDGAALVVSSSDGYCSFVMFESGELGEPHICDTGSHQEATAGVCIEMEVLPKSASPTQLADGVGSHTPSAGSGGHETASCQPRQPGDRKMRRVDFITLSRPKTVHGDSRAEVQQCPAAMDQS